MAPDVQTHITWSTLPERGFFSLYEFSLFSLIFAGSSSNFDIIWCRIQFCLCFSHLNLKIPSIFTLFSKFLSSHGHFVKSGELSTKRTKSQGRQAKHYVGRASRAICALNNVNIVSQGQNRYYRYWNVISPRSIENAQKVPLFVFLHYLAEVTR